MSKTIIEKHFHGRLEVENNGTGAIFTIALPLHQE
jgi:signal transduction histidine kinase